jgi:ABC-2 type transport system permease protein
VRSVAETFLNRRNFQKSCRQHNELRKKYYVDFDSGCSGDLVRYALAATAVLIVGLTLGFRPGGGLLGVTAAVALILLFVSSVSWLWIIVVMLVKTPESVMTTSMLLLFPMTFVSNILVDPKIMPG